MQTFRRARKYFLPANLVDERQRIDPNREKESRKSIVFLNFRPKGPYLYFGPREKQRDRAQITSLYLFHLALVLFHSVPFALSCRSVRFGSVRIRIDPFISSSSSSIWSCDLVLAVIAKHCLYTAYFPSFGFVCTATDDKALGLFVVKVQEKEREWLCSNVMDNISLEL